MVNSYGEARNTIDPGSTASSTFANNQIVNDPNNPDSVSPATRKGTASSCRGRYSRQYFNFGSTTISMFWEAKPSFQNFASNVSYVFNGDMNGDGFSGNDLIYIPRDTGEMNFATFTHAPTGRVFTAAEQTAAFEAYIQQDPYLSKHRGDTPSAAGCSFRCSTGWTSA